MRLLRHPRPRSSSQRRPAGGAAAAAVPAVSNNAEQTVTIESDLYRVVLSNRGAVARSWQLTKYTDEHEPPRTLDLVQSDASQAAGGWPFSLQMSDPQLEAAANQGLYVVHAVRRDAVRRRRPSARPRKWNFTGATASSKSPSAGSSIAATPLNWKPRFGAMASPWPTASPGAADLATSPPFVRRYKRWRSPAAPAT